MRLFLDLTRLSGREGRTTPSGIDRVEYAYLSHAVEMAERGVEVDFVVFKRLLAGLLRRSKAFELRHRIEEAWSRSRAAEDQVAYVDLIRELETPLRMDARKPARFSAPASSSLAWGNMRFNPRDMLRAGLRLDRSLQRLTRRPIYLHTSHAQLERHAIPRWLDEASVEPVFFLHDVIPIDYPEFCRPGERDRHFMRLRTISEYSRLVLANSRVTAETAKAHLDARGWRVPPFAVVPLGVEDCFRNRAALNPPKAAHPYVVVVGTIEPRKNLAFLLMVWRRLVETHGQAAPRLIVVGRRGWENENVLDYLERSSFLAPFVVEAADLSDVGLANVLAGARALAAPSLAEGFDLPVAEALSLGVPALVSDLPVHREIAGNFARYIDPLDGPEWVRAIEETCLSPASPVQAADKPYQALTWREHIELSFGLIDEVTAEQVSAA